MAFNYREYWENTYASGGNSGSGSYGKLAAFKAEVVNEYLERQHLRSVLEFGCGDGEQLRLMNYPEYHGMDVSLSAMRMCAEKFKDDKTKSFELYVPQCLMSRSKFDLVVCLDVLYHVTDDEHFDRLLKHIFDSARHSVILYTKLTGGNEPRVIDTIKDRDIFRHLFEYEDRFAIRRVIPQRYPELSSASFVILEAT